MLIICRKFGKQIQRRQLDLPEYAASFVNYKALKKVCLLHLIAIFLTVVVVVVVVDSLTPVA